MNEIHELAWVRKSLVESHIDSISGLLDIPSEYWPGLHRKIEETVNDYVQYLREVENVE